MTTATIKSTRSEVFTTAWSLVKNAGKSLSEALKEAWSKFKKLMENNTNFQSLTDEQLKEAAIQALTECFARGGELAIYAVSLIERVKAEFDQEEIRVAQRKASQELEQEKRKKEQIELKAIRDAEQEKQQKLWAEKKEIAETLRDFFEGDTDITVNVWTSGAEKRVYLNTTSVRRKKDWKGEEIACLFITGNSKNKLMSIVTSNSKEEKLIEILAKIGNSWTNLKLDIATAL